MTLKDCGGQICNVLDGDGDDDGDSRQSSSGPRLASGVRVEKTRAITNSTVRPIATMT